MTHVYKNGPADKDYVKIKVGDFILASTTRSSKAGDNYWKFVHARPRAAAWSSRSTPSRHGRRLEDQDHAGQRSRHGPTCNTRSGSTTAGRWSTRLQRRDRLPAHPPDERAVAAPVRARPGHAAHAEGARSSTSASIRAATSTRNCCRSSSRSSTSTRKLRDSVEVTRPLRGFFGPMVVMDNERSTSDAEVFPDGFRTLKLGKVVGVTTYGAVIGTGSYSAHGRLDDPHARLRPVERQRHEPGELRRAAGRVRRQHAGRLPQGPRRATGEGRSRNFLGQASTSLRGLGIPTTRSRTTTRGSSPASMGITT